MATQLVLGFNSIETVRGLQLTTDDELRRDVITGLICNFQLEYAAIEKKWKVDFKEYFYSELETLQEMASDGLLMLDDTGITVMPKGRFLIRNICMVFDRYLEQDHKKRMYSRTI